MNLIFLLSHIEYRGWVDLTSVCCWVKTETPTRCCGTPVRSFCGVPALRWKGREFWLPWASPNFGSSLMTKLTPFSPWIQNIILPSQKTFSVSSAVSKAKQTLGFKSNQMWGRFPQQPWCEQEIDPPAQGRSARSSFFTEIIRHKTLQVNQFTFSLVFTFAPALNKHLISSESVFESLRVGPRR